MLLTIPDLTETPGHRVQVPLPHTPQAVNYSLLSLCVPEELTFYLLLPCYPFLCSRYQCPLFFFYRWSSCLRNPIKFVSRSLLFFTFKTAGAVSDLKKGLLPKILPVFFSVAAGLIKDSPSFLQTTVEKEQLASLAVG